MGGAVRRRLGANGYPVRGWAALPARPQVLQGTDIVINLLPLTPATLLDATAFAAMKWREPRELARGAPAWWKTDLLAALDLGRCAAVLDVFETEPLAGSRSSRTRR